MTKPEKKVQEHYKHDDCQNCGTPSVPAEDVPDQSLRGCPNCGRTWFEDLSSQPQRGADPNYDEESEYPLDEYED